MVKTADFMRIAGEKTQEEVQIERMKIEDEVFMKVGVEMEHILIARRET